MLSCKQASQLMSQEQDRRLGVAERLALRLHVLICDACSKYRRQMAFLRQACRRFGGGDTP